MADLTYILTLKDAGDKTFVMPSGFESNVEIHCWGAGGGGAGGGGGYAKSTVQINAGDSVRLQVGQPGSGQTGGTHSSYTRYRGGSAAAAGDEDGDTTAGTGGGGASAVVVNNVAVCVGAGGDGPNHNEPGKRSGQPCLRGLSASRCRMCWAGWRPG